MERRLNYRVSYGREVASRVGELPNTVVRRTLGKGDLQISTGHRLRAYRTIEHILGNNVVHRVKAALYIETIRNGDYRHW